MYGKVKTTSRCTRSIIQPRINPTSIFLTSHTKLGDFNAHSTRWGYKNRNTAGKEIEDILHSSDEDPATYLHYNGTRTTPDLLLVLSELTQRKLIDYPGSGHKPVIASIITNSKCMTPKMPTKLSWNFKRADWPNFTNLLETANSPVVPLDANLG
nr:pol protein [Hymenolepis microstoma]